MPSTTATAAASSRARKAEDQKESPHEGGLRLPAVHLPAVAVPHVPLPHMSMPKGTAGRVLWWGGLAAVAAFGVVDWPVAALVGAGSWVAEQYAKQAREARRPGKAGDDDH